MDAGRRAQQYRPFGRTCKYALNASGELISTTWINRCMAASNVAQATVDDNPWRRKDEDGNEV
jgi:hypothetical protein